MYQVKEEKEKKIAKGNFKPFGDVLVIICTRNGRCCWNRQAFVLSLTSLLLACAVVQCVKVHCVVAIDVIVTREPRYFYVTPTQSPRGSEICH